MEDNKQNNHTEMLDFAYEHIVSQILGSIKSPCAIFTNGKLRYSNNALNKLTDPEDINSMLDNREGFMKKLEDYSEKDNSKNIISVSKKEGRRVFRVLKNNLNIDEILQKSIMYIFVDVTREEYQKIKIKSYNKMLESFVFKTRYKDKKEETIESTTKSPSNKKLTINDEENEILRRSHTYKTTAREYVAELDDDTLTELQELDELDRDFSDSIYMLEKDSNLNGIKEMANQLEKYAHEIGLLFEFKDLFYAIHSLSVLFSSVDESKLDEKKIKKLLIILNGIKEDLATWRNVIFIEQSAVDIHYLDSSLFSACLQIEMLLSDEVSEMESEEEDLILF